MILPGDTSFASGGEHDLDANTLRRLWWQERRWLENLYHQRWGATHHGSWCLMWLCFCRNQADSPCAFANTDCCHGAGPVGSDRRARHQRNHAPLWCEPKQSLSLARAPEWLKTTLLLFALTPQFLQQSIAGDELDTRVQKQVAPDASQGGTVVLRDRATRVLWEMPCGRTDRQLWKNARRLWWHVMEHTGELTLLTDGERRSGSRLFALCRHALRNGPRGRPKKTLPTGVKVRLKNKGSHKHKQGRTRPTYHAPYPEPPETAHPMATTEIPAHQLEAFPPSLRRRWAAYRRRTNRSAQATGRRQARLEVYWMVHHFVRLLCTTRRVPAVDLGILDHGFALHALFLSQKAA